MLLRTIAVAGLMLATLAPVAAADHSTFLVAYPATTQFGDAVALKARLLEPDSECPANLCPVSNRQVDFFIDGAYVGTDVTNSGGYAYLLVPGALNWHVGDHAVRVQYDRAAGSTAVATSTLTVVPETTLLAARDGYAEARLVDDDGTPVAGELVRFTLVTPVGTQDVCDAFTDADGVAACADPNGAGVTPIDLAEVRYRATFDGTADHLASVDDGAIV